LPDRQAVPAAVLRGHHVLVPFARNHPMDRTTVELPPVDREVARDAFVEMGFNESEAEALSNLAWRGLMIVRRHLAVSPALMTPDWAKSQEGRQLLPAVLAGSWDES